MRVQRFLTLKDRPLSGLYLDENQLKVELTYPNAHETKKEHYWTVLLLLIINALICIVPASTTSIIITLVGAFTSPLVVFILPGYLFYDHLSKNQSQSASWHKRLSFALFIVGIIMLVTMTTISFYIIRVDTFHKHPTDPSSNAGNIEEL